MSRTTVEFDFKIGDTVMLKDIAMPGTVRAMSKGSGERTYRVVYWNDGSRKDEWVFASEIKLVKGADE